MAAGLALLAPLVLLMALPPSHAKGVAYLDLGTGVPEEGFTLVGDDLIYFFFKDGSWQLHERNVVGDEDRVLAAIPYGDGTQIRSLRANENWIVWLDDRSGSFAMYAVERASGSSARVLERAGTGGDLHLRGDQVAFERSARVFAVRLPTGEPQALNASGQAFHPVFSEDALVFVRLEDTGTSVVSSAPGRPEVILEGTHGSFTNTLRADDGVLAWRTGVLWDPDQPGHGFRGDVVQLAPGPLGPVRNLTAAPVQASSLLIHDGHVCWLEGALARCYDWQGDMWLEAPASGTAIAASATHLAVFKTRGGGDLGSLYVRTWDGEPQASSPIPALLLPSSAAALGAAAAWRRWR